MSDAGSDENSVDESSVGGMEVEARTLDFSDAEAIASADENDASEDEDDFSDDGDKCKSCCDSLFGFPNISRYKSTVKLNLLTALIYD